MMLVSQAAMESLGNPAIPPVMILCSALLRHPNSQMTILPSFYKTEPGYLPKHYATTWKPYRISFTYT